MSEVLRRLVKQRDHPLPNDLVTDKLRNTTRRNVLEQGKDHHKTPNEQ